MSILDIRPAAGGARGRMLRRVTSRIRASRSAALATPPTADAAGGPSADAPSTDAPSASDDIRTVLQGAVDEAARLLDASGSFIGLLDEEGHLRFAYESGMTESRVQRWRTTMEAGDGDGRGLIGTAITQRRVVWTADYPADVSFSHSPNGDRITAELGIRSLVAAPLLLDGRSIGALAVYTERSYAFGERDIALARALADHAAAAIANVRLIERLHESEAALARRVEIQRTISLGGTRLVALRDPREVLEAAVDAAASLLDADGALLDLIDPVSGTIRWAYDAGIRDEGVRDILRDLELKVGEGMFGRAIAEGAVVATGDYMADDRFIHAQGSDDFARRVAMKSMVVAPLIGDAGPLGVIGIYATRPNAFGDDEMSIARSFATQATIALQNARLIGELERSRSEVARRADAQEALREIGSRLTAIHEPDTVLQLVVDEAKRLLDATGARIDLVDVETDEIRWAYATSGMAVAEMERYQRALKRGEGVAGWVIAEGRPFSTPDYVTDDRFVRPAAAEASARESGVVSLLAVPLIGPAGPFGALSVLSDRRAAFGDADVGFLEALATAAAVALANARLIDELATSQSELARQVEAEHALGEISTRISAIRDPAGVLQLTVDAAKRLLGADGAILEVVGPDDGRLLHWAYDSGVSGRFDARYVKELTLPIGVGLTGRAVAERRVLLAGEDLAAQFPPSPESSHFFETTGFRSMVAAPIIGESEPLGAIEVYSTRPDAFGGADAELMLALATQAAIAIANARLIDELASSRFELARRAETEKALREITARITALRDPDIILQRIVDEAKRLLGSDGAHLTFMAEDRTYLQPVVASGVDDATRAWMLSLEFPLGAGMNGLAATLGRPVRTDDYLVDPRIPHEPDDQYIAARLGIRSVAVVPLRAPAGEIIGTLAVSHRTVHEVDDESIDLLQVLGDVAAIAVSNSRLDTALRDSEGNYRRLVENSPDLIWAIDEEARFTFLSDTCERLTGWRADELLGGHFGGLVHPSSREVAEIDWLNGFGDGSNEIRGQVNLLHRDGHAVPAEFIGVSRIEGGRFIGANGSVRDMSEHRRLERELSASEERYRFLVENSPDIVFSVSAEGTFTFMSETIERVTGFVPSDLVGTFFGDVVTPETQAPAMASWAAAVADPTTVQQAQIELLRKGGGTVPVEVIAVGYTSPDGSFAGIHGSTRDLSERLKLQGDLRRQAAEIAAADERAHLARELHDSVTQALFSMTLLTRSVELLISRDPAAALERLVTLRDLQRDALAEMRALIFELRPGGLEHDGLVTAMRRHAAAVQGRLGLPVVVEANLEERLSPDIEDCLYRIGQEALHNVVKHAGASGVQLTIERVGPEVRFTVRDDGTGFDAAAVPPGHLGLSGMRARAEKVGGRFQVTSSAGSGTAIEVVVPAATAGS